METQETITARPESEGSAYLFYRNGNLALLEPYWFDTVPTETVVRWGCVETEIPRIVSDTLPEDL